MLGAWHLLPLLKGWQYKVHTAERIAVVRGADPIKMLGLPETGWIYSIVETTNDAYGTVMIEFQGAELQTLDFSFNPETLRTLGGFAQDPAGWNQRYFRPNPYSTAGIYFCVALTMGYQGNTFPYIPSVVVKLHLPTDSTESTAYIRADAGVIAIVDKKAFIRSLRRILDAKASLKIDDALLAIGPAPFKEVKE